MGNVKFSLRNLRISKKLLLLLLAVPIAATVTVIAATVLKSVILGGVTATVKPYSVDVPTTLDFNFGEVPSGDYEDTWSVGYMTVDAGKLGLNFTIKIGDIPDNVIMHLRVNLGIKHSGTNVYAWPPIIILAGPTNDPFIQDLCKVADRIAELLKELGYSDVEVKDCTIYAKFEETNFVFDLKNPKKCATEDPHDICYIVGPYPIWLPGGSYDLEGFARIVTWYVEKKKSPVDIKLYFEIVPPVKLPETQTK